MNPNPVKADNVIKREDASEVAFESLLRVESQEGQTIYIISQLMEHPLMQKMSFVFGSIHVYFEQNSKITCFHGELESLKCLNNDIDWDGKYFDKIATVLSQNGKEFNYSYQYLQETAPFLKITEKLQLHNQGKKSSNTTEATILKVMMKPAPQFATLDSLIQLVLNNLKRKSRKVAELGSLVEKVEAQKKQMFIEIEKISVQAKEREETLINQFVLLLNEKKKKIRETEDKLNNPQFFEQKKKKDQIEEEKQQQIIGGSQFGLSQQGFLGTLFEPSQGNQLVQQPQQPPHLKNTVIKIEDTKKEEENHIVQKKIRQ